MKVSGLEFAVLVVAVLLGSMVQGSVGIGLNLSVAPVVAIVVPEALPAALVFLAIPLTVTMTIREHEHIDWRGAGWSFVGRAPGSVVGVMIVAAVSTMGLSVLCGAVVVVAVLASLVSPPIPVTRATATTAGFTSGLFGTATSVGGPPMALLYQHHRGLVMRSTLSVTFMVGLGFSVVALWAGGQIAGWQVLLGVALWPAVFVGLAAAGPVSRRVNEAFFRPAVLTVSFAAGLLAVTNGLNGIID